MDSRQFLEHDLYALRDDEWGRGREQNPNPISHFFFYHDPSPFVFDTELQEVLVEIYASKNWTHHKVRHIIGRFGWLSQTDVTRFEVVLS